MEKADGSDVESGRGPTKVPHWKLVFDQGLITPEVLKWNYDGSGTEDDPYVVNWIDNDPRNPMLFSKVKKWSITILVAVATLAVAFVSSAYSGGVRQIMTEFGAEQEVITLGVSLFVLGFAIGPLLWAPMSELWGRQILYITTYGALTAFNAGAAGANSMTTLLVLRFLAGSFGSSPLTNAGGVIADMFSAKERGLAMSIFSVAPFMGPALGPIVGGFLGEAEGWRWVEGLMAIFTGVLWIAGALLIPETYPPVLLRKRAKALSKQTGKVYRSRGDVDSGPISAGNAFKTALSRPLILLVREPIVLLLSIYMAIVYGTLYMMFGAFPIVFQEGRGWSEGIGGLPFLGVAVGMMIAVLYTIFVGNSQYIKATEKAGGFAAPEARLPPGMIGGCFLPIGLFWFAWTNGPNIHWIVSILAAVPFGCGMVLIFLAIMNYLIDAYTIFAASVLAANSVLRSLFGFAFPLFTTQMYRNLGIHWASSIPAFLALVCVPFPFLFYKYGAEIRKRCKFAAESDAFMKMMMARQQGDEDSSSEEEDSHSETDSKAGDRPSEEKEIDEEFPRFEGIRTGNDGPMDTSLGRVQTGRSTRTNRTGRSGRSRRSSTIQYYDNPYDIDRVNTRESFTGRQRTTSMTSVKKTKSNRSGL